METLLRTNSAGIPYTLLLGIEAIEFPTFWLLLWGLGFTGLFRVHMFRRVYRVYRAEGFVLKACSLGRALRLGFGKVGLSCPKIWLWGGLERFGGLT